jgi:Tol biopolymer transport system component
VVTVAGGDPQRLTALPGDEIDPAWSPDGSRVAFVWERGEVADLYLIDPFNGAFSQVTRDGSRTRSPAWTADSAALLFSSRRDTAGRTDELYRLALGDGAIARLTESPSDDLSPALSRDGRRLAWASLRDVVEGGEPEIWVKDLPDGAPVRLTHDPGADTEPSWAPDNHTLAWACFRDGSFDVCTDTVD